MIQMADEYIRLDTTIIAIDRLINEAATGTMARTLFKAKYTLYSQQRYVIDVQPVKRGRWEFEHYNELIECYVANCSECGYESTDKYRITSNHRNCEYCGARMDGDTE